MVDVVAGLWWPDHLSPHRGLRAHYSPLPCQSPASRRERELGSGSISNLQTRCAGYIREHQPRRRGGGGGEHIRKLWREECKKNGTILPEAGLAEKKEGAGGVVGAPSRSALTRRPAAPDVKRGNLELTDAAGEGGGHTFYNRKEIGSTNSVLGRATKSIANHQISPLPE